MTGVVRTVAGLVLSASLIAACGTGSRPSLAEPLGSTTSAAPTPTTTSPPTTTLPAPRPAPNGRFYPAIADSPGVIAEQLVAVERALRDESTPLDDLPDLAVRVGCHFGDFYTFTDPATGRPNVVGTNVNTAARIASKAAAGEILVSAATLNAQAEIDPDQLETRTLELKGISKPMTVRVMRG